MKKAILIVLIMMIFLAAANAEELDITNNIGLEEGRIYSSDINLMEEGETRTLTFTQANSYVKIKRSLLRTDLFSNIQQSSEERNAYLKMDNKGTIIEAEFTTNEEGGTYIIGNNQVIIPPNSRLLFKDNKIQIFAARNSNFEFPGILDNNIESSVVEIRGEDISLPDGIVLDEGKISYKDGKPMVAQGDRARINGFNIHAYGENVELKFYRRPIIAGESGNFVRIYGGQVELNGVGFSIDFDPEYFIKGEAALQTKTALADLGKHSLGERGDEIKLIQRRLGIKETGIYDAETKRVVEEIMEGGSISLVPHGAYALITNKRGRLDLDLTGDFGIGIGSKSFESRGSNQNDFLKDLSFNGASNKKWYQEGDKGEEVKLIQKLVGAAETGVYDAETKQAVEAWQNANGITADGAFGTSSLDEALLGKTLLYKKIQGDLTQQITVPVDITLKDANGNVVSKIFPIEGPGPVETIRDFIKKGVGNRGYFTSHYKTSIHLNSVLYDNLPTPGSLTRDLNIVADTLIPERYLAQMRNIVNSEAYAAIKDPDERFNYIVRSAGKIAGYNPETSLKLIGIFGSRYKDLSPNPSEGYSNVHLVNGRDSTEYKSKTSPISSAVARQLGVPQDPKADKKYRLLVVSGQYLYNPDGFLRGTKIFLEHASYEGYALGGRIAINMRTGNLPKFGSGDIGDVWADAAAVSFARRLKENPEETLSNFDVAEFIS